MARLEVADRVFVGEGVRAVAGELVGGSAWRCCGEGNWAGRVPGEVAKAVGCLIWEEGGRSEGERRRWCTLARGPIEAIYSPK